MNEPVNKTSNKESKMNDDIKQVKDKEALTMTNLSEYIHAKVGEASTLFYDNDEHIFNESRALKISETMINDITEMVSHYEKFPDEPVNKQLEEILEPISTALKDWSYYEPYTRHIR
jgi:predicted nucleotide-binding protein (sugar kinase/HSP70/actin superfamily)